MISVESRGSSAIHELRVKFWNVFFISGRGKDNHFKSVTRLLVSSNSRLREMTVIVTSALFIPVSGNISETMRDKHNYRPVTTNR